MNKILIKLFLIFSCVPFLDAQGKTVTELLGEVDCMSTELNTVDEGQCINLAQDINGTNIPLAKFPSSHPQVGRHTNLIMNSLAVLVAASYTKEETRKKVLDTLYSPADNAKETTVSGKEIETHRAILGFLVERMYEDYDVKRAYQSSDSSPSCSIRLQTYLDVSRGKAESIQNKILAKYSQGFYKQVDNILKENEKHEAVNLIHAHRLNNGLGVAKNSEEAVNIVKKEIEKENPHALTMSSYYIYNMKKEDAIKLFPPSEKPLARESEEAVKMARSYETDKNLADALKWYKVAAGLKNDKAMFTMGKIYSEGDQEDLQKALKWYQKAFIHGNEEAYGSIKKILGKRAPKKEE